jgi:DNA-binding transcriptional MocR family regulator
MVSDQMTHERVSVAISNGPGWVSHILQRATAFLLTDDTTKQVVADAEVSYGRRRELLIHELHARGIEATGASGLNVWIPTPDEQVAVEAARSAGFAIRAADSYRIDSGPAVRVTVSGLTEPEIILLADALAGPSVRPQMVSPSM